MLALFIVSGAQAHTLNLRPGEPILEARANYLKKDAPFTETRARLIKDKWKPVRMHLQDHYVYEGVEKELFHRKFTEVDTCSMATSRCILFYKKNDRCLRLDTIG